MSGSITSLMNKAKELEAPSKEVHIKLVKRLGMTPPSRLSQHERQTKNQNQTRVQEAHTADLLEKMALAKSMGISLEEV